MNRFVKALITFLLLLVALFSLSGCIRTRISMTIKAFGKMDMTILYAESDAFSYTDSGMLIDEDDIEKYKSKGYSITDYSEDGYFGWIISKKNASFDDGIFNNPIIVKKDWYKTTIEIPFGSFDTEETSTAKALIRSHEGYLEFVLTLPVHPIAHNATKVSEDGKTLTWDLLALKNDEGVQFEYSHLGAALQLPLIIAACVLSIVVIFVIFKKVLARWQAKKTAGETPQSSFVKPDNTVYFAPPVEDDFHKKDD